MSGRFSMTPTQIQGHLKHLLERKGDQLSSEERYCVHKSIEAMEIVKSIPPGLTKMVQKHVKENGNGKNAIRKRTTK